MDKVRTHIPKSSKGLEDKFIDYIDELIPDSIRESFNSDGDDYHSFIDLINGQEKARTETIKKYISSTHRWCAATSVDSSGFRKQLFWCKECNLYCSMFEHINCISILDMVKDNLPTYTTHNQYLMMTCENVLLMQKGSEGKLCIGCGIPAVGYTDKCTLNSD